MKIFRRNPSKEQEDRDLTSAYLLSKEAKDAITNNEHKVVQSFIKLIQAAAIYKSYDKEGTANRILTYALNLPFMKSIDYYPVQEFTYVNYDDNGIANLIQSLQQCVVLLQHWSFNVHAVKIQELIKYLTEKWLPFGREKLLIPPRAVTAQNLRHMTMHKGTRTRTISGGPPRKTKKNPKRKTKKNKKAKKYASKTRKIQISR